MTEAYLARMHPPKNKQPTNHKPRQTYGFQSFQKACAASMMTQPLEVPWTSSIRHSGWQDKIQPGWSHTKMPSFSSSAYTTEAAGIVPTRGLRREEESLIIQLGQGAAGRGCSEVGGVYLQKNEGGGWVPPRVFRVILRESGNQMMQKSLFTGS